MGKIFGERIKKLRLEHEMLQKDLANELNVNSSTVGYWERGKKEPDFNTLSRIADIFNVSADYLIGREQKT